MHRLAPALFLSLSAAAFALRAAPSPPPPGEHHRPVPVPADASRLLPAGSATISAVVLTGSADRDSALGRNAGQVARVRAALRAAGVPDGDVQTVGVSLVPHTEYRQDQPPRITGYQAVDRINVKVHDAARIDPIVEALEAGGASQISRPGLPLY